MASLFECEIKYAIKDYASFEKRLKGFGAVADPYEFRDYYFRPLSAIFAEKKGLL